MLEEIVLDKGLTDVIENYNVDKDLEVNIRNIDKILEEKDIESDVNIITEVYNNNTIKAPDIGILEFLKLTSALTGIPLREYLKNYCKSSSDEIDMSLFKIDDEDEIKSILLEVDTDTHVGKLEIDVDEVEELDLSNLSIEDIEEAIEETLINLDLEEGEDPPETIEVQFKKFGNRKFLYRIETSPSFVQLPETDNEQNISEESYLENIHQIRVTESGKVIDELESLMSNLSSPTESEHDVLSQEDSKQESPEEIQELQTEETQEPQIEGTQEHQTEEIEFITEEPQEPQIEEIEFIPEEVNLEEDILPHKVEETEEINNILNKVVTTSMNDLNDKFNYEDLNSKDITSIPVDGYIGEVYNLDN